MGKGQKTRGPTVESLAKMPVSLSPVQRAGLAPHFSFLMIESLEVVEAHVIEFLSSQQRPGSCFLTLLRPAIVGF